ncbi:MAG: magnesium transporter [Gammaproteobacteria bacterium]|jgi:magnesium transporter|nr:magnesium transporter [Gammaproteobacteria bacterium]
METQDFAFTVRELLAQRDIARLREHLGEAHPADIANCISSLEGSDIWRVLSALPTEQRTEVFGYLPPSEQVRLANALNRRNLAEIFLYMSADERADLYNRLEPAQQAALLPGLAQAERDDIRNLASHEEGTAGAIMTSDYATLAPWLTASEAIQALRREAPDKETIYQAYVIDAKRCLLGTVSLRDLIVAPYESRVSDLMVEDVIYSRVVDPQEDVAQKISKYDLIALPIVDDRDRLVGIVTYDDAMDVAEQEATEDFHRVGTVGRLEESVRHASVLLLYRKRIFWLLVLIFGSLLSGLGIAYFEDTITSYVVLVFFLPLLIASGGNAGAQTATLMVRALATGDVELRDWGALLGRELGVAGLLGLTMALVVSTIGLARGGPEVAFVIATTMVLVVIAGSLIGISLPFLLSRFRLDPATASVPLVTSIADLAGVLIYFSMATMVLSP